MLVCIPNVLEAAQIVSLRERLEHAGDSWVDGRVTAGYQGAPVKFNQQIDERSEVALACQRIIVPVLERNPIFISAVLPNMIYPLQFNRYGEGMKFGSHVDGSIRISPHDGRKIRTDVSGTLFLTNPDEYDGGELMIEDTYGLHSVKLPAGEHVDSTQELWRALLRLRRTLRAGRFDRVYDLQTVRRSSFLLRLVWPARPEWSGIAPGCSHPDRDPDRDRIL